MMGSDWIGRIISIMRKGHAMGRKRPNRLMLPVMHGIYAGKMRGARKMLRESRKGPVGSFSGWTRGFQAPRGVVI
jgi:hypothetical protein